MSTPTVSFTDERLPNGLRLIIAEDHLAPVVAVNLWYDVGSKHEVEGKTGFAHLFEHVMFQGSRNVAKAEHIALDPGGRRDDERHDLARPDELLRDGPVAPAGARALARGRPDGDAPRRAQPGEPRQPARGRQEREALVVRQPAVRLVEREAPGAPVPAGAPVPPHDDRLDGGPRRRVGRGRERVLPDLLRAEQRGAHHRRRRRPGRRSGPGPSATSAASRPTRRSRRWPTCRCRRSSARSGARRSTTRSRCRGSTSRSGRRSSATRGSTRSTSPRRSSPAARAAASTGGSSARSGSPRTSRCSRSGFVGGARSRPAGRRSGPASRWPGSRRRSTRSWSGSTREPVSDDELARARALIESEELGGLQPGRGAGRPALDVRDAVRRPGPHQPDAAALPVGHRRATSRRSRPMCSAPTTGSS